MSWKRLLWAVLGLLLLALVGGGAYLYSRHRPLPEATPGPEADAMARGFEAAVNKQAWERTGALRWVFRGTRRHLWDRRRGLIEVRWDDVRVMRSLDGRYHLAYRGGAEVTGPEAAELLDAAYRAWVNDSFWLNPLVKLFDEGVERGLVTLDGGEHALLVQYTRGGVTPGDAYMWLPGGEDGRPRGVRMWVSVIPVGGVEATWSRWQTLATGARVATFHDVGGRPLELTEVAGATTLEALTGGDDPFAPLWTR